MSKQDYYKTLDIEKGASANEVKKAFYKLAQKYHPDKPEGDEAKFKEINEAYQTLSDDKKRKAYDQFGHAGAQFGGGGGQGFGGFDFGGGQNMNFDFSGIDLEDILSQFGMGGMGGFGRRVRRGSDVQMRIDLTFKEAIKGAQKDIEVPDYENDANGNTRKKVDVTIPAGIENGQRIRLAGYGQTIPDGEPGDFYLSIRVEPHETLRREGQQLITRVDVKLSDAISGASHEVEGIDGTVKIKIPAGTQSGTVVRVRGKGVPGGGFMGSGDLLVKVRVQIPGKLSRKAKKALEIFKEEGL